MSGQAVLKSEYRELLVTCMQLIHGIMKTVSHHLWHLVQLEQQQAVQSQRRQLLVFRGRTSSILRLVAQNDNDVEMELDKAATHIIKESRKLARERNIYQRRESIDETSLIA